MSHIFFVEFIFQSRVYKRGLSVVWKTYVPTGNRYVLKCGSSYLDLFLKIDPPKSREILEKYEERSYFSKDLKVTGLKFYNI